MYLLTLLNQPGGFIVALVFLLSMVVAVTVHECAHAWTAYRLGDDTPHLMGRVTLNPSAHLDPLGSILFLISGFGWGKPVIYNPLRLKRKVDELLVALAGPFSNLLLALFFHLCTTALAAVGGGVVNVEVLNLAASVNISLAAFNLLPIPPLDGSSIVAYFYPNYRYAGGQFGILIVLLLAFAPFNGGTLLSGIMFPLINFLMYLVTLGGILR